MVSVFFKPKPVASTAPDWYEKLLAGVAAVLFVIVIVALVKGRTDWPKVPPVIWAHLATIMTALMLTPYMLLRPRGTPIHRLLGKVWVTAMVATAAISLFVRYSNPGHFSFIHILSVFVLVMAPRVWLTARRPMAFAAKWWTAKPPSNTCGKSLTKAGAHPVWLKRIPLPLRKI